jgi:hypothetical protein
MARAKKDSYSSLKIKQTSQPGGPVKTRPSFSFKNIIILILLVIKTGWAQSKGISDYWMAGQTPSPLLDTPKTNQ